MQDLKRKSDKADVEPDPTRRSPSDRDMAKSDMADLAGSGIGSNLGNGNGKEWLMTEIKLMEDNYKNACERRAKIMRFHAEVLERNLHHIYPRAPGFMLLGYQSACQEWDRRRRNVAAYTSRAAEVYVEPVKPASPMKTNVKTELEHQTKGAPTSSNPNLSNQTQSSHQEAKAPTSTSTQTGSTTIPPPPTSKLPSRPSDGVQKGLLPSVEIIPQAQAQSGSQPTYDPPHTNLDSNNVFPGNNDNDLDTNGNGGRAMEIDIDLTMDSSDLPTLDPGEMALFDFINSVANSPTAFETVAPSTAGGMTNTETNTNTGMDPGLAGMTGSGQDAGAGLDFGLLEAGLQNEIARTGQDAPEGVPKDGPAGTEVQPGLAEGSTSALNPEPLAPQARDDPNGANVDPLDLFSKYPDLFNFQGPQDYTSSFDGNNNNNINNNNNANGTDTSTNADVANGNTNGVFDPDSFDYSMLDPNAFFADGMQGMDGM